MLLIQLMRMMTCFQKRFCTSTFSRGRHFGQEMQRIPSTIFSTDKPTYTLFELVEESASQLFIKAFSYRHFVSSRMEPHLYLLGENNNMANLCFSITFGEPRSSQRPKELAMERVDWTESAAAARRTQISNQSSSDHRSLVVKPVDGNQVETGFG